MDCKATVNLGEFARGGKTRGPNQALDPDFGSLRDLEQQETRLIQLKIDNGPESSGIRTQFLKRIVDFSNEIGRPIQLLCYPPYHSKYNPIERCWGILEQHWNRTLLRGYSDPLSMGTVYDLEGNSSQGLVEEQDLQKRHLTL